MTQAGFDLATAAASRERRASPRYLLYLAIVALVVSIAAAAWSWIALRAARTRVEFERRQAILVRGLVEELHALEARASLSSPEVEAHARNPNVVSTLEGASARAGLAATPRRPQTRTDSTGNVNENFYTYAGLHDQPEALLRWVETGLREIPGLEVWSITLEPTQADWKMDIVFRRWEFKP